MLIRRETPADAAAIAAIQRAAFAPHYLGDPTVTEPPEPALIEALRADESWMPTLSLVALAYDTVVGHVCLTRAGIGPFPVLALGPLGVDPDHQKSGVGSALVHAALGAADALDESVVGLVGDPDYYSRFGFVPGARRGIVPDQADWADYFQVRPLAAYDPAVTGEFRYPAPFYDL
ncbi:GNAT family N-acetyltransferase [Nocardia caishijiensis]|uniref:Acetyltransferase n=1 Tax=Nocardia caishijiensis TaxID=184756 RepID=A0ABQ6YU36_9NOCA|nr:N-acetyltransferase [Nocardia caishijiensis]KAF0848981.1 putative acetyltransferase [Nocardia caishijiensis]